MATIKPDQLTSAIEEILAPVADKVKGVMSVEGRKLAKEVVDKLKSSSPKRPGGGSYAQSWAYKKDTGLSSQMMSEIYVVYNKDHYRLTHLLEFGHIIVATGGRTREIPHISQMDEYIAEEYPKRIEEGLAHEL